MKKYRLIYKELSGEEYLLAEFDRIDKAVQHKNMLAFQTNEYNYDRMIIKQTTLQSFSLTAIIMQY